MDQEETLDKIDLLRQRMGVGYTEAKKILDKKDGDVIAALVELERDQKVKKTLNNKVHTIFKKGSATRLKIKKDGRQVAEIPVAVGIAGILGSVVYKPLAIAGAIGTLSAIANRYTLEVEKPSSEDEPKSRLDIDSCK
ncbi:hypothetical protein GGQ84_001592 [Desulfitispora alkaliphila]|uniref:DUF4342 domain-containing protein n=1 Tax=Desulfitispora alkaliphila TaxID=622674 RepID=UPI003D1D85D1